jgi:hypothetical protein
VQNVQNAQQLAQKLESHTRKQNVQNVQLSSVMILAQHLKRIQILVQQTDAMR